ncbi:MAG: hypothetical protein EBR62_08635 [Verrucomicrobia bacterium]|nr:hypothetical protein [Verrucomicrobiota bacterium]
MSILGKIGAGLKQFGKYYTSPEGLQTLSAVVSDYGQEDSPNYTALMARREKLAQQQRQQQAIAGLLGSYRGPDMQTAGVNELIGGANDTGAGFGMAPMQRQAPRWQQGFDMSDPNTQSAFANYIGAGGSPADIKALTELGRTPKPSYFNTRSGVVAIDPDTNTATQVYEDRYAAALADKQAQQYDPTVTGTPAWNRVQANARANQKATARLAPRGAAPGGPVKNQPTRIVTY